MNTENVEQRNKETNAAGLIIGETACNRSACQAPLSNGSRMWNTETYAFYCTTCAKRINKNSILSLGKAICIAEWKKNNAKTDCLPSESNRSYLKYSID